MKCHQCGSEWKTNSNIPVNICPFCGKQISEETPNTVNAAMRWIIQNKGIEVFRDATLINAFLCSLCGSRRDNNQGRC